MDPYIGEIRMFAGNYAPDGWALCNGQLMPISQYTALFAILGTTYGGNGTSTFALPDLRGRLPMHAGQGPGLSPRALGELGGEESVTLLAPQMPAHSHALNAVNAQAGADSPANAFLAQSYDQNNSNPISSYTGGSPNTSLNPASVGAAGGSQPHDNMPPFGCVNFIIALNGVFPPHS
ncbi:MAG TPA: tail fiber protein [Holophagaceae bacterium]